MTAMNTIRAIETLTRTGFSEEQARAVVGVVSDVVEDGTVTKLDFVELKAELRNAFAELKAELRNDFAGQQADMRSSPVALGRGVSRQIAHGAAKVEPRGAA